MQDLRNATVVVAGASSGMGLATALAFARRGVRLVLVARREEERVPASGAISSATAAASGGPACGATGAPRAA